MSLLGSAARALAILGTAWHVNGALIARLLGYYDGTGSPVGVISAEEIGQTYRDSATGDLWTATATGTGGWRRLFGSSRTLVIPPIGGKVGSTAGWVITAGDNIGHATLPAGVTAGTLIVPIYGLEVGDIITGWAVNGQCESAGNTATLAGDLRKLTPAAADNADASISTDASGNLTADTIVSVANVGVASGLTEVVAAAVGYYLLLTGTTAASTDFDITNVNVFVQRA